MPPPSHQTFAGPNFVICSFCPRKLDFDPLAIPIPYHHSNLQSEEMIYYVDGQFSSRKGIEIGSVTLHPSGIPHGPQPGLAEKSIGATETHELAVMCDTFHPLRLSKLAKELDDRKYAYSWYEEPGETHTYDRTRLGRRRTSRGSAVDSLHRRSAPVAKLPQRRVALRGSTQPVVRPRGNARKKRRATVPEQGKDLRRLQIHVARNAFEPAGAEPGVALRSSQGRSPFLLVLLQRASHARRVLERR